MKNILVLLIFVFLLSSGCTDKDKADVMIKTSFGDIKIDLYDETPIHKENFIKLVTDKYYDGLIFHRCIPGFMIQGGDPQSKSANPNQRLGNGGPGYTLEAEIKFPHFAGALCAARTGGPNNPEKRSSGSQFYIVDGRVFPDSELDKFEKLHNKEFTKEERAFYTSEGKGGAPMLDTDYTVFGMVVEGLDVIKKINAQKTGANNRPVEDIKMEIVLLK